MEGKSSKINRAPSSLLRSSVHSLAALDSSSSDPEEIKHHSPPHSTSTTTSSFLSLLPTIFLLILSFFYLKHHSPSLPNLSLASAAVLSASLISKPARVFLARRRSRKRSNSVQWFIGDVENPTPRRGAGRFVKEGVEFYSNGDFYEGEFHKGKCSGSGVYNFFGQGRYEGDWIDGKFDGCGIERWARGSRYRGQYRRGLRHGFGVYRFYNGDSYAGEWVGGQSHGRGVQNCSDGSCYVGEFQFGVKHGLGFYHFRNGDKYAGEYFGDKIHGFGVYNFANGHCYEGSWHEGRRQGFGTYTFRRGETKSGEWDRGTLKNPLPLEDSSVQRAVQSARKASEKSVLRPRVEDQVNKAVGAANIAATTARVAAIRAVENRMNGKLCNT